MDLDELVRTIYGTIDPAVDDPSGRGTGAGQGFRGSRGTPGYPVPPELYEAMPQAYRAVEPKGGELRKWIENYREKLAIKRHLHVPPSPTLIGKGTRGEAYDIGGGKVLKLTDDQDEAEACHRLMKLHLEHVVEIFDVFQFGRESNIFGIVQEKLTRIPNNEALRLNFVLKHFEIGAGENGNIGEGNYDAEDIRTLVLRQAEREQVDDGFQQTADMEDVLERYQIFEMIADMQSAGIKFSDYHAGNIMMRGSQPVLIDPGYSMVGGGHEHVDVLERVRKTCIEALAEDDAPTVKSQQDDAGRAVDRRVRVMRVVKLNAWRLQRRGIELKKDLGAGSWGIAWDIGKGQVLKATMDDKEALASNLIKGKRTHHVVRIQDVFQFPDSDVYGIVQEKLRKMSATDAKDFDLVTDLLQQVRVGPEVGQGDWEGIRRKLENAGMTPEVTKYFIDRLEEFQFPEIIRELKGLGIEFYDYHSGNLMMRGNDYVVIDLGRSNSAGKPPPVLERLVAEGAQRAAEAKSRADRVGATIGRFQPFHKGHAELIRNLARRFTKVIVLVAGNRKGPDNPFSFDLRVEMMRASLPDVESKLEVYRAEVDGKPSGFVPGILDGVVRKGSTSVRPETAVTIIVGQDRYGSMVKQVQSAQASPSKDGLDVELLMVERIPRDPDSSDSGSKVRTALERDDRNAVEAMLDPHVMSDQATFDELYGRMRKEIGSEEDGHRVDEHLTGQAQGEIKRMLDDPRILAKLDARDIQINHPIGHGSMGIAYDIGGRSVLKVTTDDREAATMFHLMKVGRSRKMKHIVRIHDVFRFPSTDEKLYGIVQELLKPMAGRAADDDGRRSNLPSEGSEADRFDQAMDMFTRDYGNQTDVRNGNFNRAFRTYTEGYLKEQLAAGENEESCQKHVDWLRDELEYFQIPQIMQELSQAHVRFSDYHSGNLMKRGNDFVITDIGVSDAPRESGEPPVLEKIIRKITEDLAEYGQDNIVKVLMSPIITKKLIRRGIDAPRLKRLATGMMGVAYDMGDGKVLKVTTDKREAQVSYYLAKRGQSAPNIVHIFEVFRIPRVAASGVGDIYGIVQEKLTPLQGIGTDEKNGGMINYASGTEAEDFEKVARLLFQPGVKEHLGHGSFQQIMMALRQKIKEHLSQSKLPANGGKGGGDEAPTAPRKMTVPATGAVEQSIDQLTDQRIHAIESRFKKFNFDKIITQLRELGIDFIDFHSGNLMKRGSQYVLVDMGFSEAPQNEEPPALESIIREVAQAILEDASGAGAMGGVPGSFQVGTKAGSSGWSAPSSNMTDDDEEGEVQWQDKIDPLRNASHIMGRKVPPPGAK